MKLACPEIQIRSDSGCGSIAGVSSPSSAGASAFASAAGGVAVDACVPVPCARAVLGAPSARKNTALSNAPFRPPKNGKYLVIDVFPASSRPAPPEAQQHSRDTLQFDVLRARTARTPLDDIKHG